MKTTDTSTTTKVHTTTIVAPVWRQVKSSHDIARRAYAHANTSVHADRSVAWCLMMMMTTTLTTIVFSSGASTSHYWASAAERWHRDKKIRRRQERCIQWGDGQTTWYRINIVSAAAAATQQTTLDAMFARWTKERTYGRSPTSWWPVIDAEREGDREELYVVVMASLENKLLLWHKKKSSQVVFACIQVWSNNVPARNRSQTVLLAHSK